MKREAADMLEALADDAADPIDGTILRVLAQTVDAIAFLQRHLDHDGDHMMIDESDVGLQ